MPRSSPYFISLTAEERRVLEARARRYTLPYRDVVRAKIVLLAAEGLENKEIGERPFRYSLTALHLSWWVGHS